MIVYDLIQPSLNGTSTWLWWLGCPRKAAWDLENRRRGIIELGSEAMQIGTLVHGYLDLYHTQQVDMGAFVDVQFRGWGGVETGQWHTGEPIDPVVQGEALRVATAWAKGHSWDHFGRHVMTEITLPDDPEAIPSRAEVQKAVTGSNGRSWSGRLDILASADGDLWEVIDWKTIGRVTATTRISCQNEIKTKTYMLAAAAAGYRVKGARIVLLVKTKKPYFDEIVIPFPSRREVAMIHGMFEHADRVRRERGAEVNLGECFGSYGDVCKYLQDGSCNRIGG